TWHVAGTTRVAPGIRRGHRAPPAAPTGQAERSTPPGRPCTQRRYRCRFALWRYNVGDARLVDSCGRGAADAGNLWWIGEAQRGSASRAGRPASGAHEIDSRILDT